VFVATTPFVTFVNDVRHSLARITATATCPGLHQRHAGHAIGSLSHCATFCTWLI
jgi:hypothetical protein